MIKSRIFLDFSRCCDEVDDATQAAYEAAQTFIEVGKAVDSYYSKKQMREDQMYYYEDQKNWMSPANQMALRRAAGLNPYGDFTTGSVGQPQPVDTSLADALNGLSASMNIKAQRRFEKVAQRIAFKQLELEETKVDNDTQRAKAQASLLSSQATYQNMVNFLKEFLMGNEINLSDEEVSKMLLENGMLAKAFEKYDDLTDAQIESLLASGSASRASASLSEKQKERIDALLPYEKMDYEQKTAAINFIDDLIGNFDSRFPQTPKAIKSLIKAILIIAKNKLID